MVISEDKRRQRMGFIGGSDIGALFGVCPFKSAAHVWATKIFHTEPEPRKLAAELGNALEPAVLKWCAEETGLGEYLEDERFVSAPLAVNLDGRFIDHPDVLIEAKTTRIDADWGEPGTNEVPPRVLLQTMAQMMCVKASGQDVSRCIVPAWFIRNGAENNLYKAMDGPLPIEDVLYLFEGDLEKRLYEVQYDHDTATEIMRVVQEFWDNHVLPQVKPCGPPPSMDFLKLVEREENGEVFLHGKEDLILEWLQKGEAARQAYKAKMLAQEELVFALGKGEIGVVDAGVFCYTRDRAGRRTPRWKPYPQPRTTDGPSNGEPTE